MRMNNMYTAWVSFKRHENHVSKEKERDIVLIAYIKATLISNKTLLSQKPLLRVRNNILLLQA